MLDIKNKEQCTGCGLCKNICPQKCITYVEDEAGFNYPKIDTEKCINCNICVKKCPKLSQNLKLEREKNPKAIAAWNKNINIRLDSTSGGVFSALAKKVLEEEGYICGAIYDENNNIKHIISNKISDLEKIRSSKYAQSDFSNIFEDIKRILKTNKVLVCGTPCQISALYKYLGKDNENLITCDFICRGVNSPKIFKMYLNYLETKYKSKIKSIKFKDKTYGWHNFSTKITFENGKSYVSRRDYDTFMIGYLEHNAFMRDCCYDCSFKYLPRESDFTLADFWGIELIDSSFDDDKGTSLVLINSSKASNMLQELKKYIRYKYIDDKRIFNKNVCMTTSPQKTKERELVINNINNYSYKELSDMYFKEPPFFKRSIRKTMEILSKIKRKVIKK